MTVLGTLARAPRNVIQATPWGDWGDDGGSSTYAGANVRVDNATQLLTVYGCTRFIAHGIATIPLDVFTQSGDRPVEVPTPQWLVKPTPELDFVAWCGQVLTSLLLAGNAYCLYGYTDARLSSLTPIDPTKVTVRRERNRKTFSIEGKSYSTFDILHIPGLMWPGDDVGMSPVAMAKQMIGLGMALEEFGGRFLDQGATLSGVIEVPGDLNPQETRDMARAWAKKHSGSKKSHLPGVLKGGAQWKPMGVTNEQAQFLETKKYTASQIASQMFMIDPPEMGLPVEGTSLTYSNQEQRDIRTLKRTYLPWIIAIENALNALLPRPRYVKFNVNAFLRGDTKARFDAYSVGIRSQFLTPNEARDFEDWEPLPGGDEFPPASNTQTPPPGG